MMKKREFLKSIGKFSNGQINPDAWKESSEIKEQFELIRQAEEKLKNK